jgi:hypothetical protein
VWRSLVFVSICSLHPRADDFSLCTVKFSIESFRIPELYVEVPETATVASLKVWIDLVLI